LWRKAQNRVLWSKIIKKVKIYEGLQRQRRRRRTEEAEEEGTELLNVI
jgi:hypothetical protein